MVILSKIHIISFLRVEICHHSNFLVTNFQVCKNNIHLYLQVIWIYRHTYIWRKLCQWFNLVVFVGLSLISHMIARTWTEELDLIYPHISYINKHAQWAVHSTDPAAIGLHWTEYTIIFINMSREKYDSLWKNYVSDVSFCPFQKSKSWF